MQHILVASDLTEGSANALRRAMAIAASGAALRVVHAVPPSAPQDAEGDARGTIEAALQALTGCDPDGESRVTIRICRGAPAEVILEQADAFDADLIVLGAHGEPRLRDAIFGTIAAHVVRRATRPVLVAQGDADQAYSKVMVAVDNDAADQILDLALSFAAPREVHVVHAFGSAFDTFAGAADRLEDVRTNQDVLITGIRQKLSASGVQPARFESIVEEGDEMDVVMRAWTRIRPDLVVMGTHGRTGFAHLVHGSLAETALLGCPSDMLVMRTGMEPVRP